MLFSEYMSVIMRIALSIAVFSVFGFGLDAQSPVCEGPPELEKVIRTRPSAGRTMRWVHTSAKSSS